MTDTILHAALEFAARGWPVLPIKPGGKLPLTEHGVHDATTDPDTVRGWFEQWPDANVAIACGHPGPTVLDIDDPAKAGFALSMVGANGHRPLEAATARGKHLYFAGTDDATINVGYGEIRGKGSYVVAPPSIHPSGREYVWLNAPNGPLSPLPSALAGDRKPAGAGVQPPRERVGHGERHDHLKDLAVRLVRAGIITEPAIERALQAEYDAVCDPNPPARPDEFRKLAKWAVSTRIAGRERNAKTGTGRLSANTSDDPAPTPKSKPRKPPGFDATTSDHKLFVGIAGGWHPQLDIVSVKRFGPRLVDAMLIELTNGLTIDFARQGDITARGVWTKTVIAGTNGLAAPLQLKDWELGDVYRSLCIIATTPIGRMEAEDHEDLLADLLKLTEPVSGHTVADAAGIYRLGEALRTRPHWEPGKATDTTFATPVLVIDSETGERYIRAGELQDYFRYRKAEIATREFPGRMSMIGLRRWRLHGRAPEAADGRRRATNTLLLYQLPDDYDHEPEGLPPDA